MRPFFDIREIAKLEGYEFESPCRAFSSYAFLGEHTALCRVLSKYKMYIDTRDRGITPHLIMDGFWETWLTQYLARTVQSGDTCLDIGANLGYYSILMSALAGDSGTTIAFEPNPRVAALLRSTGASNSPGFLVEEQALSDRAGKNIFHIPDDNFGDASLLERADRKSQMVQSVEVKTNTLDDYLKERGIHKVDVIKMDVEGAEPFVFRGMEKTIAANPQIRIIVEYTPYLYSDALEFTEYLFAEFVVSRIKDVSQVTELNSNDIPTLVALTDHTDLCLEPKDGKGK